MTTAVADQTAAAPGAMMAAELAEQPAVWQPLLAASRDSASEIARAAALIEQYQPRFALFLARGTSDHAALYGKYLTEITHQRPCGLVSPSTMTAYGAQPDLTGVLMSGVRQSGGSPDLGQSLPFDSADAAMLVKRWDVLRRLHFAEDEPNHRATPASSDLKDGG
jgi:glucosamine--fructose-6-phosphate aminotransferase (isomerizing)